MIGIDEAGYGPNLGPLVVGATAWHLPATGDLDELLAGAVIRAPIASDKRLLIADSKAVYQPGGGLAKLERAVYATGGTPRDWSGLVGALDADPTDSRRGLAWHRGFDPSLPRDAIREDVTAASEHFRKTCEAAGVETVRLAARLVFPEEFNRLVREHGTKGAALSFISIGLARRLHDSVVDANEPCELVFDKHGGRNRYGALIQEHFDDAWVEVREESRPQSVYRAGERLTFRFRSKGELELPVALASMTAKLLRELSMKALNDYWLSQVPGVKPTAGYPVDAKRFKAAIGAKQAALGIADDVLWRSR